MPRLIPRILPHSDIDEEKVQSLLRSWVSLEPIFTYFSKFPGMQSYIADIVAHADTEDIWKEWRYSTDRDPDIVDDQIGHLSPEQLTVWKDDHITEVGDVVLPEVAQKPERVYKLIQQAVVRDKHIYREDDEHHEDVRQNGDRRIQKTIESVISRADGDPDGKERTITQAINRVHKDADVVDAVKRNHLLPDVRKWIAVCQTNM